MGFAMRFQRCFEYLECGNLVGDGGHICTAGLAEAYHLVLASFLYLAKDLQCLLRSTTITFSCLDHEDEKWLIKHI
jgi:hypothetical protein